MLIIEREFGSQLEFYSEDEMKNMPAGTLSSRISVEATRATAWRSVRVAGVFASPTDAKKQDEADTPATLGGGAVMGQPRCVPSVSF